MHLNKYTLKKNKIMDDNNLKIEGIKIGILYIRIWEFECKYELVNFIINFNNYVKANMPFLGYKHN